MITKLKTLFFKLSFLLVYIFIVFHATVTLASLHITDSVSEIREILKDSLSENAPSNILFISSLEGFLLTAESPILSASEARIINDKDIDVRYKILGKKLLDLLRRDVNPKKKRYMGELALTEYPHKLSDPEIQDLFQDIQKYNIPIIVKTDNVSGPFNKIPHLEVWSFNYLKSKGIDLSINPFGEEQIIFDQTYKKIDGTYPTFYKGLLSCNRSMPDNSASSIISNLLSVNFGRVPPIIYVVDSDKNFIEDLQKQFTVLFRRVKIIGIVYQKKIPDLDNMPDSEILSFWQGFIKKLNKVTRTDNGEDKLKENAKKQG